MINKKQLLRIYLSTSKTEHRKFYWFELCDYDLYWGSSSARNEAFCKLIESHEGTFILQTPKEFKYIENTQTKYSFHESGQFHKKELINNLYGSYSLKATWPLKQEISEPFRFFCLITEYEVSKKNVFKKDSYGLGILLNENPSKYRIYFEFFICKSSKYKNPKSLINFGNAKQHFNYWKIITDFTIMIRYSIIENLNNWFPEKEIIILD